MGPIGRGGTVLYACSSSTSTAATTTKAPKALQVLVINDDGYAAPGIDAAVQALRALPDTKVTVVAPLTNQSGTGGKTTTGTLTTTDVMTASAYPAKAVAGYPADTIVWAIDDHGISFRPDLVVSGINFGENVGPLASGSGNVGAAQGAESRGIAALAVGLGIDDGMAPDFAEGSKQFTDWVTSHRATLLTHPSTPPLPGGNLNVPTCSGGSVPDPVNAALATSITGIDLSTVDCTSTATNYTNDAEAFVDGFAVIAPLGMGS